MKKFWINSSTEVVMRAFVFLTLCAMAVSGKIKCKPDEVKMCANKYWQECFCRKCLSCPPGYGPNHPCGGRYVNGSTIIRCIPCISGKNYSDEYSIASCKLCVQCEGKETLQECAPKSKRICSTVCQEGYSMNYATDECFPDPSFKTPPAGQSSTTAKWTTTHLPKATTTQQPSSTTPIQLTKMQTKPHGTTKPSTHPDISGSNLESNSANNSESNSASNSASNLVSNSASGDSSHSRDNKIIILSVSGIALVVVVVCFLRKRQMFCFSHATGNQNSEEMALTYYKDPISPRSSQEIVPWPDKFHLKDIESGLRSNIANYIREGLPVGINGWRAIGEKLKLSQEELVAISAAGHLKTHTNEGEQLLLKLSTCQPELTLTEFVNILEYVGRKDVVNLIKDHYNNVNKANSNANQISVTPQNSHPEPEFV